MPWLWPLKDAAPLFPDAPGQFGTVRRHDVHTGIDLYCELGQEVVAVEDGEVVSIENFTGPNADDPSPWWNDTKAMLVKGPSWIVNYGEIEPTVKVGDKVKAGQVIARVERPVLRSFKGRPMVMLHIELMTPDATVSQWWRTTEEGEAEPQPEVLLDPTAFLVEAAGGEVPEFVLSQYDGQTFMDPLAKKKDSPYWAVWGGSPE